MTRDAASSTRAPEGLAADHPFTGGGSSGHGAAIARTAANTNADATPGGADRLVIGDAVELDLTVARLGSRGLARLIDLIAQLLIVVLLRVVLTIALISLRGDEAEWNTIQVIIQVIAFIAYPVVFETLTRGRTPGKLAMGLRVVRDDGGAIRFRQAFTRGLVGMAAEWPGLLPPLTWAASLWCMLSNRQSKRFGDVAAGTIVIHERTPVVWGWIPVTPPHLAAWAATLDLAGLDDRLALDVRQFLVRYRLLSDKARARIGANLTNEVIACITPPPPAGVTGRDFLVAVLAERHRRSAARISATRTATAVVWPELAEITGSAAAVWTLPPPAPAMAPRPGTPDTSTASPATAAPEAQPAVAAIRPAVMEER